MKLDAVVFVLTWVRADTLTVVVMLAKLISWRTRYSRAGIRGKDKEENRTE